jgi:hypothetical protein
MRQPILTSVGRWAPSPESRIAALLVAGVFMPPFFQVLVQALGWEPFGGTGVVTYKSAC